MIEIDKNNRLGTGSNSVIYTCKYRNKECAAKVPRYKTRYISCVQQAETLRKLKTYQNLSFEYPRLYCFVPVDSNWREIMVMKREKELYSLDFLLKHELIDISYLISKTGEAVAQLHNCGVSGYDIELYWSFKLKKLVILDIGPSYTIGCSAAKMIRQHYCLAKNAGSHMALWNLVSELMSTDEALKWYKDVILNGIGPSCDELINCLDPNAEERHIKGVAENHYLQIFREFNESMRSKFLQLFIKYYIMYAEQPNFLYIKYLNEAFEKNIKKSEAFLYISKYRTLSKMSNTVELH